MTRTEALECLGLSGSPTPAEIRAAFQSKTLRYHPDRYDSADEAVREVMTEKMRRLVEARDLLMGSAGASQDTSATSTDPAEPDLNEDVSFWLSKVQVFRSRRQFREALSVLDALARRHGSHPEFLEVRVDVLGELERHGDAYHCLGEWERVDPSLREDPDFQHYKATVAVAAEQYAAALLHVRDAHRLAGGRVPAFVGTEAYIQICRGDTKAADELIEELRRIDPSHPIVAERAKVMNIGGNYVGKSQAANSACCVCVILELLLDCI